MVQFIAYKQTVSMAVQLTLIPIIAGVGYATVYDLNLNVVGLGTVALLFWYNYFYYYFLMNIYHSVFAGCAVVATSMAQIFTNTYQKSLDCNALQLLHLTSPYIALVRLTYHDAQIYLFVMQNVGSIFFVATGNADHVSNIRWPWEISEIWIHYSVFDANR